MQGFICGLLITLCTLTVVQAQGATLHLTGDSGVEVTINGDAFGRLPLDGPVSLEPGRHLVGGYRAGSQDYLREVVVRSSTDVIHLRLDMIPLSRKDAVTYSLMLAGTGQRYLGRNTFGWVLTIGEIGGLLTALMSELSLQNSRDDYLRAQSDYDAAIRLVEIERLRGEVESNWQDMQDAESRRNTATTVVITAISLSVLDALFRFPSFEAGSGSDMSRSADGFGGTDGFHVGLGFKF